MININDGSNLVFVCGAGHSGTTLLLAILDSHEHISAVPHETGVFHRYEGAEVKEVVASWFDKYSLDKEAMLYVEKTPVHATYLDKMFTLFPCARVVFITRDGRDSTLSEEKRLGDYKKAVQAWVKFNKMALPYFSDDRVHVVKYEDLILSKETVLRKICGFLQIEFDESMLEHQKKRRTWWDTDVRKVKAGDSLVGDNHKINRNWQINQPIFTNTVGRWKTQMNDEQKSIFSARANDILIQLGYEVNSDW